MRIMWRLKTTATLAGSPRGRAPSADVPVGGASASLLGGFVGTLVENR